MKGIKLKHFSKNKTHIFLRMNFVICFMLVFVGVVKAVTVYVAIDGSGNYNCDGVDDHVEINLAIAAANTGDTVHINAGTYIINDTITINNSGVVLEGDGDTSILRIVANATEPPWTKTTPMMNINNNNIIIQNLKFDGNYDNQMLPSGANYLDLIHVNGDNAIIQANSFYDGICDAIDAQKVSSLLVSDNYFCNISHEAVTGVYANSTIRDNEVYLNTNAHGTNAAFRLYRGDYNVWKNNTISRKAGITRFISMGFEIHSYNNNSNSYGLIENNIMMDQYANAIIFNRASSSATTDKSKCTGYIIRNNIINNVIFYTSDYSNGIKIWDTHWNNFIIENNVIYSAAGDGIWLGENVSDIVIKNNIIVENDKNGIAVWSAGNISNNYNDVWNNTLGNYSGISAGIGDISADPLFADVTNGDFHLKSKYGRWDGLGWVCDSDAEHSPCIDAGDPASDYSNEPAENGGRINIGAYGNAVEASKSYVSEESEPEEKEIPENITIYPNPYIAGEEYSGKITFANLPKEAIIKIHTISGKLIKTIKHEGAAGGNSAKWDISGIASGIYIYWIESSEGMKNGKVSIIK